MNFINNKLKEMLDKNGVHMSSIKSIVPLELEEHIQEGVTLSNDALVFSANLKVQHDTPTDRFVDLTGYECFINEINVDGYLNNPSFKELLEVSIACVKHIENLLKDEEQKIKIICSVSNDEFLTSTIRFHIVREKEEWLSDDINSYEEEGLLVTTIN